MRTRTTRSTATPGATVPRWCGSCKTWRDSRDFGMGAGRGWPCSWCQRSKTYEAPQRDKAAPSVIAVVRIEEGSTALELRLTVLRAWAEKR